MNIKKTVSLSVLFVSVLLQVDLCYGQSNVVYYGANSNAISLAFADTNLSESAKSAITADLRVCLSEWGKGELRMRIKGDSVGYIDNPTHCPHYPEDIEFPENVVPSGAAGLALHIPKKLSDAYTNAFAFAAANSNIVAAAYEFVAFAASSNFMNIASNTLPDYVILKNVTTNQVVSIAGEILTDLHDQTYYPPSILGFYYDQWGPETTNLWMNIPCSILSHGNMLSWFTFHAIWHDGKWRFCMKAEWVP